MLTKRISDRETVNRYASQRRMMIGMLDNLREFLQTMPAPVDGEIPNVDYGYTGSVDLLYSHLSAACKVADELSAH